MAIAKIGSTGSSAGAINYVLSENKDFTKQPEILGGSFGTMAEIKQEFEAYNKLNSRVKNQATHISISLAPGEKLKTEKKIEFAERLMIRLDFKNVPYLIVEHFDKDQEHFHLIAGRIRQDGTTVKEWEIAERVIKATKVLEKEFGLKEVAYTKSKDRRLKSNEYKMMERTNELSVMAEAKFVIDEVLKSRPHTRKFVESLQKAGFEVRPNISDTTGRMNGFSFKKDKIKFKSSSIAKNYSWKNLQKNGLDYDYLLDTEYLKGVKNEFTPKLNLESKRDRGTETPESIVNSAKSIIDRTESISNNGNRQDVTNIKNRTTGLKNLSAVSESIEAYDDKYPMESAKQSDKTKISDRTLYERGHGQNLPTNGSNKRETAEITESKDNFVAIDVSFSEPKLNPAPRHELDKKHNEIESDYSRGRSR